MAFSIPVTATVTHPIQGYSVICIPTDPGGGYQCKALTNASNWRDLATANLEIWRTSVKGKFGIIDIPTDKPATIQILDGWLYVVGFGVGVGTDTVVATAVGSKLIIDTTALEEACTPAYPRVVHPRHYPNDEAAGAWVRGPGASLEEIDPDYQRRRRSFDAAIGDPQNVLCGEDAVIRQITGICKAVLFYPLPCWDDEDGTQSKAPRERAARKAQGRGKK
jgi:hypothetical protein